MVRLLIVQVIGFEFILNLIMSLFFPWLSMYDVIYRYTPSVYK